MMPRKLGVLLLGAVLVAAGITSAVFAAPAPLKAPSCYSSCPSSTGLTVSADRLTFGSEQSEVFTVTVSGSGVGAPGVPTGTVAVRFQSTTLCTVVLVSGSGTCSPSPDALPAAQRAYPIKAFYNGDGTFSGSRSPARPIKVSG